MQSKMYVYIFTNKLQYFIKLHINYEKYNPYIQFQYCYN